MRNNDLHKVKRVCSNLTRENNEKWFHIIKLPLKNKKIWFIIKNKTFLILSVGTSTINKLLFVLKFNSEKANMIIIYEIIIYLSWINNEIIIIKK